MSDNAALRGGGICNYRTTVTLNGHSAVWGNGVTDEGGGIFNDADTVIGSTRVYANTPEDIAREAYSSIAETPFAHEFAKPVVAAQRKRQS